MVVNKGIHFTDGSRWIGYWGKHLKAEGFRAISHDQKVRNDHVHSKSHPHIMSNRSIISPAPSIWDGRTDCGAISFACRRNMGRRCG